MTPMRKLVLAAVVALVPLAGCANLSPGEQRAVTGTGVGAAGGALLGAIAGNAGLGAGLGAAAGLAGALLPVYLAAELRGGGALQSDVVVDKNANSGYGQSVR